MKTIIKKFEELSTRELYEILRLRVDVFVVEQECAYPEIDGKDIGSIQLYFEENSEIIAYMRILPKGMSYESASLGRVIVKGNHRGKKLGNLLLEEGLKYIDNVMKEDIVTIGAQEHLENFYEEFGFVKISPMYLEDGIKHIDMRREISKGE
ncbi:ElaA protein [Acetoanaerobium pronyense]|uniref:ElaA protein n=1 Tax=Acetoanaerobium pronyense TaxID=1482736 RepID=A0ABS4KHR7_9FIRM|nr:GNAT family N-acetyltransferase [Acetoanaerobium pronyense]MBP2027332.1 ElaA protein [Acetoanaerobium pronyense]